METRIIKNFPGYIVSEFGDVYSVNYNHTGILKKLSPCKNHKGYLQVHLWKNNKGYSKTVHRLVAEAFLPNINNLPEINHINGDKTDNCVKNLEWISSSDNLLHSYRVLGRKHRWGKDNKCSKIILQIKDGSVIAEFYGANEASRCTKVYFSDIHKCCKGKLKTAGGYIWKYKGENL